ncbi:MAG: HmuY family protein [Cyclobacteriaceae bacterium]
MKGIHSLCYLALFSSLLVFTSCDDEDDTAPVVDIEAVTVEDIQTAGTRQAPDPTFFDLESGEVVDDSRAGTNDWDIAFDNTTILINSGISGPGSVEAQVLEQGFDNIEEAPESGYQQDTESSLAIPSGSGNGWYNYTSDTRPTNAILPILGRTIVLRTNEGHYAKMEILSWYQGNPDPSTEEFANFDTRPESRYFTFRYALQTNGSRQF